MARKIPHNFTEAGELALATYSYVDIASGRGVLVLYAGDGTDKTIMSNNLFYSNNIKTLTTDTQTTTFKKLHDMDFDIEFLRPMTFEGEFVVSATVGILTGGSTSGETYLIIRIRKVPLAGGEIELADNQSDTLTSTGTDSKTFAVEMDVAKTHFKIGESLRVTVEQWVKGSGISGGGPAYVLGHDPKDRNDPDTVIADADTTQLIVNAPVLVDL